jgi:hypothetical protein
MSDKLSIFCFVWGLIAYICLVVTAWLHLRLIKEYSHAQQVADHLQVSVELLNDSNEIRMDRIIKMQEEIERLQWLMGHYEI